ncbi:MAG: DUF4321 domain-containing protein [Ruminococcus sp.]|uniref:DUF4321 domain-containing protein n=1 Tax=Ruminococcus sp. TaxID=41978 RepID=UPI0025D5D4D8|nr:DUF4321 domain-containing protein [Ruminococcus sp.]MCR5540046.1 DUF4321 domain-containing protein [Ruminococcus sp.]
MDKFKKTFAFLFFILSGIVLGGFLASVCTDVPYFYWMSWGRDLGVENFAVDFYVIRFNLGFMIHATLSQMVTITLALVLFSKIGKNL